MRRLYGVWAGTTFTAITFCALVLLVFVPGLTNRRRLVRATARLSFFVTGTTPRVIGYDNLPSEPCVVVANHASYLDGIILTAVLPARFAFVIKREMAGVPFAAFLLRRVGSEFVERHENSQSTIDTRRIIKLARSAESLAFFPEGTFTSEPGLKRFRNGAFVAALRGDLQLVPVAILGSRRMLPAGQLLPSPGQLRVIIKPALVVDPDRHSVKELNSICRSSILSVLEEPDALATNT